MQSDQSFSAGERVSSEEGAASKKRRGSISLWHKGVLSGSGVEIRVEKGYKSQTANWKIGGVIRGTILLCL